MYATYLLKNNFEKRGLVGNRPKHGAQYTARLSENFTSAQKLFKQIHGL